MVTFLFDISLKRKLLIISCEERTEFAEDGDNETSCPTCGEKC